MYVTVLVTPAAKRERFAQTAPDAFLVSVREPAVQNRANRRTVQLVAEHFSVSPSAVRIISGHRARKKVLSVDGDAV